MYLLFPEASSVLAEVMKVDDGRLADACFMLKAHCPGELGTQRTTNNVGTGQHRRRKLDEGCA